MAKNVKKTKTSIKKPSREEAEDAVRTLIRWIGEDPAREGILATPRRVVKAFEDYYSGYSFDAAKILSTTFGESGDYQGPVLVRNIEFESRCEHHLAPFIGVAHVAYIPAKRVVGLSKIARIVDIYARRMQVQERMTMDIAKALEEHLKPKGLAILLDAQHFCMKVRGVHKNNASTITTHFSGAYRKDDDLREEFLMQIRGSDR
jgi:GTP cyclohydrolase I